MQSAKSNDSSQKLDISQASSKKYMSKNEKVESYHKNSKSNGSESETYKSFIKHMNDRKIIENDNEIKIIH